MFQKSFFKSISVIGLGYIGLPTAAIFASHGIRVTGVDINQSIVEKINRGEIHIVEPGLEKLVKQVVANGYLRAVVTPEPADAFLIAVPTPFTGDNHEPDLSYIESAARAIARVLKVDDLVILESTSPVGATDQLSVWLAEERPDLTFPHEAGETSDIRVVHCPERVLPGKIMIELVSNDRIIGGMTPLCGRAAKALYETFVNGECIQTNARTAEMCKLTENSFRDVNIAYANELSIICDKKGIDVWELIQLANRHPRVNILQPGAGVGGHCIAVDPWFIVASSPKEARLIRAGREVNDAKPEWVLEKVDAAVSEFAALHPSQKPIIAVLGLSFKPDIDDLRESPALGIAKELHRLHVEQLIVVEPHIGESSEVLFDKCFVTLEEAIDQANILVVLVKHSAFLTLKHQTLRPGQQVIDVVGLLTEEGSIPESWGAIQPINQITRKA